LTTHILTYTANIIFNNIKTGVNGVAGTTLKDRLAMTKEKMPKGQIMTYMYQTLQTTAD
jgi:hypothetical protein